MFASNILLQHVKCVLASDSCVRTYVLAVIIFIDPNVLTWHYVYAFCHRIFNYCAEICCFEKKRRMYTSWNRPLSYWSRTWVLSLAAEYSLLCSFQRSYLVEWFNFMRNEPEYNICLFFDEKSISMNLSRTRSATQTHRYVTTKKCDNELNYHWTELRALLVTRAGQTRCKPFVKFR